MFYHILRPFKLSKSKELKRIMSSNNTFLSQSSHFSFSLSLSLLFIPSVVVSKVWTCNTVNMALRTMGWDSDTVCGHGFRATARTMLHETTGIPPDAIEAPLGHRVSYRLGSAYNRTKHLDERRKMMQVWADYLDELRSEIRAKGVS